ncbi:MAG: 16S rRNA (adenine(1518)-N(6)/adenine(1519)-N(6))-dimethyltransferase RsmA [Desulfatibacillaceae bacterium]
MADDPGREHRLSVSVLLGAGGLQPKKSAGQNFLADYTAADAIVRKSGVGPDDVVLEIGAGLGSLTHPLARAAKHVIAVEWDRDLVPLLRRQMEASGLSNVTIRQRDILGMDLAPATRDSGRRLFVFGNLPYNISSQILAFLVEQRDAVDRAVLMFQKEMAERICAPPGKKDYGRISVLARYAARITPLMTLSPALFSPRPGVDSMVLRLDFLHPPQNVPRDEALFFQVVRTAFSQRRKTLRNSLSSADLPGGKPGALRALEIAGIDPSRRAETLDVEEFTALADAFSDVAANRKSPEPRRKP